MSKKAVLAVTVLAIVFFTVLAYAEDRDRTRSGYHSRSYQDCDDDVSVLRPGSPLNPITIIDKESGVTYEIKSKYPDFGNGNLLAPGSKLNPYTIKQKGK